MKLAIISTTIHGDQGYRDYDDLAHRSPFSEVNFIISGDLQSPKFNDKNFSCNIEYLDVEDQKNYTCSEPIGWKKYARRNIALLRAIELNPDYILMVDDDNRPTENYFSDWYKILTNPCTKQVKSTNKSDLVWHNYLRTGDTDITLYPRGFPISFRDIDYGTTIEETNPISVEEIGVFQGISLGDPDIDAISRIVYPKATPLNSIKEKNFCLQNIWSPYNTQNTLFSRKLFPLAFTWPNSGRYEDIYASLVWQQFLFQQNMYVHVGDAMNYQIRGKRNNLKDFSLEVTGYLQIENVLESILQINTSCPIRFIKELSECCNGAIQYEGPFLDAYLEDVTKILNKQENEIV